LKLWFDKLSLLPSFVSNYRMMTITQIQYALILAKYKSYHKASQVLDISQPALSMQIQKFEKEVGFQIFDRNQRVIEITERGALFLQRATSLQTDFLQLTKLCESLSNEPQGILHIGIIPTIAPYLLPFFVEELTRKYAKLRIHIKEALTEEIIEGIRTGELDAGILSTPLSTATEFEFKPLFYEGFKIFVSPLHPLASKDSINITDIDIHDLWLLKEGNCFRNQVINMCDFSKEINPVNHIHFESTSIESLCRIVEHQKVLTIIPELSTMHVNNEKEHLIKDITGQRQVREVSLMYLPNAVYKNDLHVLSDVIISKIPKRLLQKADSNIVPIVAKKN
jgi:LysR family transcriptional regulator, hydrogen peroxide-inducible genes activator